jgi:hypothetical protein
MKGGNQIIKDYFKHWIEIDSQGNLIDWQTNKQGINIIAAIHGQHSLFEIGFQGTRPYTRSRAANVKVRHRLYIGLNKNQYHISLFLFLVLNTLTVTRTEKENVFFDHKTKSYPRRKYSVDKRDAFFIADLMYIECFKNEKFLKRIRKIIHSISKLAKLKSQATIIEKLQLILQPCYSSNIQLIPLHILLIHLLKNQTISKFHNLIQHVIFNLLEYSFDEYQQKQKLIESSTRPTVNLQLRIIKEYPRYIVFEIFNQ